MKTRVLVPGSRSALVTPEVPWKVCGCSEVVGSCASRIPFIVRWVDYPTVGSGRVGCTDGGRLRIYGYPCVVVPANSFSNIVAFADTELK